MRQNNISASTHLLFWLLFASVTCIIMSQLVQNGNFLDGTLYTTVGKNLAEGRGTFWETNFSKILMRSYHEQPPLYFGLLAIFYKILGTSYLTERFFCAVCFAVCCYFITKIWLLIHEHNDEAKLFAWLPLLLFALFPVVFWAYSNMVSEVLMTPFVLASVFFSLKYQKKQHIFKKMPFFDLIIAAFFIFCASMTKGLQGTFGLVVPFVYILTMRLIDTKNIWRALAQISFLFGIVALIYGFLLWSDAAVYTSFERYFHDRIVATFTNKPDETQSRFFLIRVLCNEFILAFVLGICAAYYYYKDNNDIEHRFTMSLNLVYVNYNWTKFFLLIGAAGTLPLLITAEQRNFYLTTAMPYFALGFAVYLQPAAAVFLSYCQTILDKKRNLYRFSKAGFITIFCAAFIFMLTCFGKTKCNNELLADTYLLQKRLPNSVVAMPKEMWFDFEVHAYLARHCNISLDVENPHSYFIIKKEMPTALVPDNYKKIKLNTQFLDVYALK